MPNDHFFLPLITVTITKSGDVQSYWDSNYSQPYFDNSTKRDVTVTIGQTAMLHCRVRNLGDRAVSMISIKKKIMLK
jgi:cytochrome c oxidase assembly protein Cox11